MRGLLAILLVAGAATGQTLDDKSFDRWLRFLRPAKDELRWQSIPWRASLWTAVREAHEAKKPILLWAMNGHPLACT